MATIVLHHDIEVRLVPDPDGDLEVQTADGTERRRAEQVRNPAGRTRLRVPDDFDPTPRALTDLVASITQRHSSDITGVSGEPKRLVTKLAALLDAEVLS